MFSSFSYLSPLVEAYEKMRIDSKTNTFRSASTTPSPQQQKRYPDTDDGYEELTVEDREYYAREIERLKKLQARYREMAKRHDRSTNGIGFAETAIGNTIQKYQNKLDHSQSVGNNTTNDTTTVVGAVQPPPPNQDGDSQQNS